MATIPSVFRAYDVRGIYPEELDEEIAYKTALATAKFLKASRVVVGGDYRLSSPQLKKAVIQGFVDAGCRVYDLGFVPTPVFYFGIIKMDADGGIMVTASHNPPEWNGLKINGKNAIPIYAENGIYEIGKIVAEGGVEKSPEPGSVEEIDLVEEYIEDVASRINPKKPLRIVVDCGNGACGTIPERILEKKGCDVETILGEPDGRFPVHIADPLKEENMRLLEEEVKKRGADLGLALDGDGDRIGVVDEKGRILSQDNILLLLASHALSERKGPVVFDVRVSKVVTDRVRELGGDVLVTRVGHAYLLDEVMKSGAVFGGELSGHMYFPYCYHPFDDGIFACAKMAEFVSSLETGLAGVVDSLPKPIATPEIHVSVPDEKKFDIVERLKEMLASEGFETNDIDGVRVETGHGWGLVRASNTEPMIKCRFEADTEEELESLRERVMSLLESVIRESEKG